MKELKNTKTEANLKASLTGESLARSKYAFYEEMARKEGQDTIAQLFRQMIQNETYHAKIWYTLLNGPIANSESNIMDAANGENSEWRSMYPDFAAVAREEGFEDIADLFEKVAAIEKNHEEAFLRALIRLKTSASAAAEQEAAPEAANPQSGYRCMFCGAVRKEPLNVCDVCEAIGAFEPIPTGEF